MMLRCVRTEGWDVNVIELKGERKKINSDVGQMKGNDDKYMYSEYKGGWSVCR